MKHVLKLLVCLTAIIVTPSFAANLPTGYTELEYIESTGTQYIDTGIISYKNTDILKTKVRATDVINTQFITFQNPSSSLRNIGLFITGSTVLYQYGSTPRISGTFNANTDYTLETSNGYLTKNGSKTTRTSDSEFTVETHLLIGAANNNISGIEPDSRMFKGRIYYYKYEDKNGTVLFDGIPAKRNSDNSIGMYDLVSGTFFTNAGTGTFTAGPAKCRNLFDSTPYKTGYYIDASGNEVEATQYQEEYLIRQARVQPSTQYTISLKGVFGGYTQRIHAYDAAGNWLSQVAVISNITAGVVSSASFTTPANCAYIRQGGRSQTEYQLELGSTATAYVPYCAVSDGIKIATTKYTEDAFAGLMTTLESAITKVTNIVDTTVQQATEIGNLATTKQDRPDTDCPAGRKCLLIMGADNKPHWYLIQE